jgi:2-iminobutanoate/2-iminopropanoate deaminase
MTKYINDVETAPKAIGPYSQAVLSDNFVFLSGQIPINPETGQLIGQNIEEQANQVLKNIRSILSHLELDFSNVVKTTIFLTDLGNFKTVNMIYEKWLGTFKPARSTIQVAGLPLGSQVEIEMIASLKR